MANRALYYGLVHGQLAVGPGPVLGVLQPEWIWPHPSLPAQMLYWANTDQKENIFRSPLSLPLWVAIRYLFPLLTESKRLLQRVAAEDCFISCRPYTKTVLLANSEGQPEKYIQVQLRCDAGRHDDVNKDKHHFVWKLVAASRASTAEVQLEEEDMDIFIQCLNRELTVWFQQQQQQQQQHVRRRRGSLRF